MLIQIKEALEKIANIYGFQIIFCEQSKATHGFYIIDVEDTAGITNLTTNLIYIYQNPDVAVDLAKTVTVLAHEVGHATDHLLAERLPFASATERIEMELIAWAKAKCLLKKLGFTEWDKYERYRKYALRTYGYLGP